MLGGSNPNNIGNSSTNKSSDFDVRVDTFCYEYYNLTNEDEFINSVDLDNNLQKSNIIYQKEEEIIYDNSEKDLIESLKEFKLNEANKLNEEGNSQYFCKDKFFIPEELVNILKWSDVINSSINFYLKKLSGDVNNLLIKNNIINKSINEEILEYFLENNFLVQNPYPFIVKLDLTANQSFNNINLIDDIKYSKIYLFNVDQTELEFYHMNLNVIKNKILILKNQLVLLIKKEKYWKNKKYNFEKSSSLVNEI